MENLMEKAKAYGISKAKKVYSLLIGNIPSPKEVSKSNPFNAHTLVIATAITEMVNEGIKEATKEAIMEKAVSLGLYTIKESKSSPSYIFSWWLVSLKANGFIAKD